MSKIIITPFLIVNPIVVIWMAFILNKLIERGGFAMIMAGLFEMIIVLAITLLIVDRVLVNRVKLRMIYIGEGILILIFIGVFYVYI